MIQIKVVWLARFTAFKSPKLTHVECSDPIKIINQLWWIPSLVHVMAAMAGSVPPQVLLIAKSIIWTSLTKFNQESLSTLSIHEYQVVWTHFRHYQNLITVVIKSQLSLVTSQVKVLAVFPHLQSTRPFKDLSLELARCKQFIPRSKMLGDKASTTLYQR